MGSCARPGSRARQRLRPWEDLSGPLILGTPGHVAGQRDGRQLRPALRPSGCPGRAAGASTWPGLLLIWERSGAGSCARRGSRAAAAPSALGWSIGAAAADPGRVRPRCRAERRAAAPARPAASCRPLLASWVLGTCCRRSGMVWACSCSGKDPARAAVPARIEGSGSTFGGRAAAIGAKISKGGYPFHKTGGPGCSGRAAGASTWPGLLLILERSSAGSCAGADRGQRQRLRRACCCDRCQNQQRRVPVSQNRGAPGCSAGAPVWAGPACSSFSIRKNVALPMPKFSAAFSAVISRN